MHRSSHTRWGLGRDYRNLVLPLLQCNAERLVRTQDLLAQVGRTSPPRQACPLFIYSDKLVKSEPLKFPELKIIPSKFDSVHLLNSFILKIKGNIDIVVLVPALG